MVESMMLRNEDHHDCILVFGEVFAAARLLCVWRMNAPLALDEGWGKM